MLDILGIRAVLLLHLEVLDLNQTLQVVRLLRQVELLDDPRFADGACLVLCLQSVAIFEVINCRDKIRVTHLADGNSDHLLPSGTLENPDLCPIGLGSLVQNGVILNGAHLLLLVVGLTHWI